MKETTKIMLRNHAESDQRATDTERSINPELAIVENPIGTRGEERVTKDTIYEGK